MVDPGSHARLFTKIESFPVFDNQVSRHHTIWRRGKHDSRLRPPCARSRGEAIPDNHVVVRVQAVGDLVKNSSVFVIGDQTISDGAIFIADIEPNSRAAIRDEPAFL